MAATLVWLPAETQWVEATLIRSVAGATPTSTTAVCIRQDIGTEVTVPQMHLLQREQLPPGGLADLTQLSYLHEPAILDNLRLRFCCGQAPPASAGGAAEPHADAWAALQAKFAALDERAETELISASSAGDLADGAHSPPPPCPMGRLWLLTDRCSAVLHQQRDRPCRSASTPTAAGSASR